MKPEKKSTETTSQDKVYTTDDSGRIIPIEDYAELHGEKFDADRKSHVGVNTSSARKRDQENVFQQIANMKERYTRIAPTGPMKIICRYCHKFIEKDKIREHNFQVHPKKKSSKLKNDRKLKSIIKQNKFIKDEALAPEGEEGNIAEKLKQALDESRYGAKGMHHRHEWDGKFGSTPLHDDYSDESDSE